MKILYFSFLILLFFTKVSISQNIEKAYFAGGCFWCMEESFEKLNGVEEVISGYSGGITTNPTGTKVIDLGVEFKNGISQSEINNQSGDIIYLDNRQLITRDSRQKEDIKVILEF